MREAARMVEGMSINYPTSVWPEIDMREETESGSRERSIGERNAAGMARKLSKTWTTDIRFAADALGGESNGSV
jgi:hypothetical protein